MMMMATIVAAHAADAMVHQSVTRLVAIYELSTLSESQVTREGCFRVIRCNRTERGGSVLIMVMLDVIQLPRPCAGRPNLGTLVWDVIE